MKNIKKYLLLIVLGFVFSFTGCDLLDDYFKEDETSQEETKKDDPASPIIIEDEDEYVHITFDGANTKIVLKGSKIEEPSHSEKEGYDFIGWMLNDNVFDFNTEINEDINLESNYKLKVLSVTFDNEGKVEVVKVNYGESVSKPNDPEKEGYQFVGWYFDEREFSFDNKITSDITLNASFALNIYTVTFDSNGEKTTKKVEINKQVAKPSDPTKTGYDFEGWFLKDSLFDFSTPITGDIELVASFKIHAYTVSIVVDGKTTKQSVNYLEKVSKPTNPTKSGYSFDNWYSNGEIFDFNTKVTTDLTITAKFNAVTYQVTFKVDGETVDTRKVNYNATVTAPTNPTKTGYTFEAWYNGSVAYNFSNKVTSDLTLTAKFTLNTYTVTFKADGVTVDTKKVNYNTTVTAPSSSPTKTGYTFDTWYNGSVAYNFSNKVTSDLTLTAKFTINTYTVTFKVDSKTVDTKTVNYNAKVSKPTNPTKTGYTFICWLNNSNEYNFDTVVTKDITLEASFTINTYTVLFKVDGVTTSTKQVTYNQKVAKPTDPTKSGYTFVGWYNGSVAYNFDNAVTANITLTAKFNESQSGVINVTYDFGYDCFQTKADLRDAYYTDFYNFLVTKGKGTFTASGVGATYEVTDLTTFLTFMDMFQLGTQKEMGFIGNAVASYYITKDEDGKLEDQPDTTFVGWCYKNGKYVDFLYHLIEFFAYWRTDEGYSAGDVHGNDFFYSSWASMVDTAKFFHFTSSTLRTKDNGIYSWFNSSRVDYALDHIPGVGYVDLTYSSSSAITLPTDVTRPGYTFNGWVDSNGTKVTTVTSSMTVKATWSGAVAYSCRADAVSNGYSDGWYCATPSQTGMSYLYGNRIVLVTEGDHYVVSAILKSGESITTTYAYRLVWMSSGSYLSFDSAIKVGQKVVAVADGDYITFNFYDVD